MKKLGLLLGALLVVSPALVFGQLEKSIKLNEIMTHNTAGIQDEYGTRGAWIEIANISHTTYNIRGMYITTDRSVINPSLSAPERIRKMSIIPNGEPRTSLNGRQHLVFFCNTLYGWRCTPEMVLISSTLSLCLYWQRTNHSVASAMVTHAGR